MLMFETPKWKAKNFTSFMLKFHETYNYTAKFGNSRTDGNGLPTINTTHEQRFNIVTKAVKDVFEYLDTLLTHKQTIIDYATWYKEKYGRNLDKYPDYIQLVTCHCVVQSEFLAGDVPWTVLNFIPNLF